jgi:hypothetical protein
MSEANANNAGNVRVAEVNDDPTNTTGNRSLLIEVTAFRNTLIEGAGGSSRLATTPTPPTQSAGLTSWPEDSNRTAPEPVLPPDTALVEEGLLPCNPDAASRESFLSVGKSATAPSEDHGRDLVKMAFLVGPAGKVADPVFRDIVEAKWGPQDEDTDVHAPFIDDNRDRGERGDEPTMSFGSGFTPSERRGISKKFLDDVGWRDHCDGNRITTTAGDKIEIVQGNYKLIVMGRQSDPGAAMGWEASGSHVQDFAGATMPGASVKVIWIQQAYLPTDTNKEADPDYKGGAWLLQNSTERVYQYSRYAGNFKDEFWGDLIETYIGSENPRRVGAAADDGTLGHAPDHYVAIQHDVDYDHDETVSQFFDGELKDFNWPKSITSLQKDDGQGGKWQEFPSVDSTSLPRGNPHIIERTWATAIDTRVGSVDWRIPEVYDSTHTKKHTIITNSTGAYLEDSAYGSATKHFNIAGGMYKVDEVYVGSGNATINTVASGAVVTNLTAPQITNSITAAQITDTIGSVNHTVVEVGLLTSLFLGGAFEVSLARRDGFDIWKNEFAVKAADVALQKQETALSDVKNSLTNQVRSLQFNQQALQWEAMSLQKKSRTLAYQVSALQVNLGAG